MGKIEYPFFINTKIIEEVKKIAHEGTCSKNFIEDLDNLAEEAKLRPNKDLHWDLSRLISMYYAPELVTKDRTFGKMHAYLLTLWRKALEKDMHTKRNQQ